MKAQVLTPAFATKRSSARNRRRASALAMCVVVGALSFQSGASLHAQTTAGPYERQKWGQYYWSPTYNPATGYAMNGVPGIGVSPWNPIVQAQLNLGLKTARYSMYNAWADQSNAAANLYYQQAMAQAIQNAQQQQQLVPSRVRRSHAPAWTRRQLRADRAEALAAQQGARRRRHGALARIDAGE